MKFHYLNKFSIADQERSRSVLKHLRTKAMTDFGIQLSLIDRSKISFAEVSGLFGKRGLLIQQLGNGMLTCFMP